MVTLKGGSWAQVFESMRYQDVQLDKCWCDGIAEIYTAIHVRQPLGLAHPKS